MLAGFAVHIRFVNRTLVALALSLVATSSDAQLREQSRQTVMSVPQSFEPNRGQAGLGVDFISHGPGYTLLLTPQEADLQLIAPQTAHGQSKKSTVRMKWLGTNKYAFAEGYEIQAGKSNYLIGNDRGSWRTDVPHYGRVQYRDVYPGIGVAYYGNHQQLEYDLVLGPHADPRRILLDIEGADRIRVDENGDLVLTVGSAEVRQIKPVIYQDTATGRRSIEGRYVNRGQNRIGFQVSRYDKRNPLTIDPVLVFSTYFGGNGDDIATSLRLDAAGNIYIGGTTGSTNFAGIPMPGTPPGQPLNGTGTAAFAAKISPSGTLIYSTYVGGTNDTAFGAGIAVDGNGNLYLVGNTGATDFPTVNPIQAALGGNHDAFILELNSGGNGLIYSTYLGGSALDYAERVEVDSNANAYVVGSTGSTNFPTFNAEQLTFGGSVDAFAAKISAGGTALIYSTYIGGSGVDFANGLAIDSSGDFFAFGDTGSTNFPVLNAFQSALGGATNGWLTELSPTGTLVYSTYIGGSGGDAVRGAKIDSGGNIYLTGNTTSTNFPILNAIQPTYGGGANDAWVAKLNPSGSSLIYSTYLGGSSDDDGWDLALDVNDNVYVVGETSSTNFPIVNAIQNTNAGSYNAFLTKINASGTALVFSTYLGGNGTDWARQLAVDAAGKAYLAGQTSSTNFPTVDPLQAKFGGGSDDAFVAIVGTCAFTFTPPSAQFASTGGPGSVGVTTTPECGWTATTNNSWITLTSQVSGQGSGSISYTVAPNTGGSQLSGNITIADLAFSVVEYGNSVTLTSVGPNNGVQGTSVPVTLTGTNFGAGSTVNLSGSGVTVSSVVVVSATQITATFTIAANASTGGDTVTVTSGGQNSNGVTFTVTAAMVPVLNSLSPASGGAGNSVPVTLTGTNFIAGATLSSTNSGLSFSNVNVVSSAQVTATFVIASNATLGSAPVMVTTANGTSNGVGFTIQAQFTPIRVDAGSKQTYTDPLGQVWSADSGFTGGFLSTVNHAINGTPAPTLYQTVHAGLSSFTYAAGVPNGNYTVDLKFEENQYTQSGKRLFNVLINGQQVLTNFDIFAAAGAQYQAVDVPIPVTVTSGTISIQFVPVLNGAGVFAIEIVGGTPAGPTVASITPSTGAVGTAVPVTITGTNLLSDAVINAGPNITVNNITVVSATQVNATFNVSASAPLGQANVTVTTEGGATAPSPFTIAQ
jgi:Malectin domain/Beta-propeller repeat